MLYYIIPCCIISYYVTLESYIISYHIISYRIILNHIISYDSMSSHVLLSSTILLYTTYHKASDRLLELKRNEMNCSKSSIDSACAVAYERDPKSARS